MAQVLSLFDGMSGGQIALRELGVNPIYYASEVDKFAIAQTQLNFPDTIQLGDVTKWREWNIDWASIDLLLAGSPCQGFSFAGKQLAFTDPRSALFFVFADILNHIRTHNPNVKFLLENVAMKKEHMVVISEYCGVFPVNINSNLMSAQNRNRWYWSNIQTKQDGLFGEIYTDIPQPDDRELFLKDIIEDEVDEKYFIKTPKFDFKGMNINGKSRTLRTGGGESQDDKHNWDLICVAMRGRNPEVPSDRRKGVPTEQRLEPNMTGKTNCLTSVTKDNLILQLPRGFNKGGAHELKSPTLTSNSWEQNNVLLQASRDSYRIRRLTPTECARLQTIPEWYRWECSETQQRKMLGNGWTIEPIKHILQYLN